MYSVHRNKVVYVNTGCPTWISKSKWTLWQSFLALEAFSLYNITQYMYTIYLEIADPEKETCEGKTTHLVWYQLIRHILCVCMWIVDVMVMHPWMYCTNTLYYSRLHFFSFSTLIPNLIVLYKVLGCIGTLCTITMYFLMCSICSGLKLEKSEWIRTEGRHRII